MSPERLFEATKETDTVGWNIMMGAYMQNGDMDKAVELFRRLPCKDVASWNTIVYGLMRNGDERYFSLMKKVYGIKPGTEHFTCMADLYGRAGRLDETKDFIHLSSVWKSFLSACRLHKNLEPSDEGPHVLMSNMCAANHRWEEAAEMRRLMQQRGINKVPGQSWIQLKNQVHSFIMGDQCHPHSAEIYSYLDELIARLKEIGYATDAKSVTQDVEEEQRSIL